MSIPGRDRHQVKLDIKIENEYIMLKLTEGSLQGHTFKLKKIDSIKSSTLKSFFLTIRQRFANTKLFSKIINTHKWTQIINNSTGKASCWVKTSILDKAIFQKPEDITEKDVPIHLKAKERLNVEDEKETPTGDGQNNFQPTGSGQELFEGSQEVFGDSEEIFEDSQEVFGDSEEIFEDREVFLAPPSSRNTDEEPIALGRMSPPEANSQKLNDSNVRKVNRLQTDNLLLNHSNALVQYAQQQGFTEKNFHSQPEKATLLMEVLKGDLKFQISYDLSKHSEVSTFKEWIDLYKSAKEMNLAEEFEKIMLDYYEEEKQPISTEEAVKLLMEFAQIKVQASIDPTYANQVEVIFDTSELQIKPKENFNSEHIQNYCEQAELAFHFIKYAQQKGITIDNFNLSKDGTLCIEILKDDLKFKIGCNLTKDNEILAFKEWIDLYKKVKEKNLTMNFERSMIEAQKSKGDSLFISSRDALALLQLQTSPPPAFITVGYVQEKIFIKEEYYRLLRIVHLKEDFTKLHIKSSDKDLTLEINADLSIEGEISALKEWLDLYQMAKAKNLTTDFERAIINLQSNMGVYFQISFYNRELVGLLETCVKNELERFMNPGEEIEFNTSGFAVKVKEGDSENLKNRNNYLDSLIEQRTNLINYPQKTGLKGVNVHITKKNSLPFMEIESGKINFKVKFDPRNAQDISTFKNWINLLNKAQKMNLAITSKFFETVSKTTKEEDISIQKLQKVLYSVINEELQKLKTTDQKDIFDVKVREDLSDIDIQLCKKLPYRNIISSLLKGENPAEALQLPSTKFTKTFNANTLNIPEQNTQKLPIKIVNSNSTEDIEDLDFIPCSSSCISVYNSDTGRPIAVWRDPRTYEKKAIEIGETKEQGEQTLQTLQNALTTCMETVTLSKLYQNIAFGNYIPTVENLKQAQQIDNIKFPEFENPKAFHLLPKLYFNTFKHELEGDSEEEEDDIEEGNMQQIIRVLEQQESLSAMPQNKEQAKEWCDTLKACLNNVVPQIQADLQSNKEEDRERAKIHLAELKEMTKHCAGRWANSVGDAYKAYNGGTNILSGQETPDSIALKLFDQMKNETAEHMRGMGSDNVHLYNWVVKCLKDAGIFLQDTLIAGYDDVLNGVGKREYPDVQAVLSTFQKNFNIDLLNQRFLEHIDSLKKDGPMEYVDFKNKCMADMTEIGLKTWLSKDETYLKEAQAANGNETLLKIAQQNALVRGDYLEEEVSFKENKPDVNYKITKKGVLLLMEKYKLLTKQYAI